MKFKAMEVNNIVILSLLFVPLSAYSTETSATFFACGEDTALVGGETKTVESRIECGVMCISSESCNTFSWNPTNLTCRHFEAPYNKSNCDSLHASPYTSIYSKELTTAKPPAYDCRDILLSGQSSSGVYTLMLNDQPIEVYCDLQTDGGGWLVVSRRQDGSVAFNRTWQEYKGGFGDNNGEFWIGNEIMHLFTMQGSYDVRFDLWDPLDVMAYAQYSDFTVAAESDFYRLNFATGSYTGTAGDGLENNWPPWDLNGQGFSTLDVDHDGYTGGSCAVERGGGGWWFDECGFVSINALYGVNADSGNGWFQWKSIWEALKKSEMKIRSV